MTYAVGDRVRVYRKVHESEEVCSHGERHRVPWYSVKSLTVAEVRSELIIALNYTSDGWGDVLYAVDTQGRLYRKEPHWDGPRATLWVRQGVTDLMGRPTTYDQYPRNGFARDATGRQIHIGPTTTRRAA